MTTMTTMPAETLVEPRARFRDLLTAEWLKLWSLRSTPWSFVIGGLVVTAFNVGAAYNHVHYWYENDAHTRANFIPSGLPLLDAFTTSAGLVMVLAASTIGALAITGEYSTGLIRTTFVAVPARRSVMAAKVCVITAAMTGFGTVLAAVSFTLTQAILPDKHAGVSISHPGALRVVAASALVAPLSALVGTALGALLRHSAPAVVSSVVILLMLPLFVSDDRHWSAVVDHALPFDAWMRLVDVAYDPGDIAYGHSPAFPWTVTGAWTVYAIWALAAATITVTTVHHRDQ
jgi:ABC-2 type transport system permease protein